MAKVQKTDFFCDVCGTEVTIKSDGSGELTPIYCCGVAISEVEVKEKKSAAGKPAAKTAKKTLPPKKTAVKKIAAKPAAKAPIKVSAVKKSTAQKPAKKTKK